MSQHLKTLFGRNQELRPLLDKVQVLTVLQRHFVSVTPPYLAESSRILGLRQGELSVAVANATIAAKLRQLAPELTTLLQKRGCEVSGIRVKVQVSHDYPQPRSAPHKLSKTAQSALLDFSLALDDSPLKRALEKLLQEK
ncbi:MAG: DUF721 domain-containing protein [Nitrosomonadales bacterium]|nr:DUF721 domain-containing protein [Nitrosomonadales bacterium]